MYPKFENANKDNLCNYFACSIWAGGFLIGRSEQSPTSRAQPSFGGERGLIPEQRLDTEPSLDSANIKFFKQYE